MEGRWSARLGAALRATTADVTDRLAAARGDALAIRTPEPWSYRRLHAFVAAAAEALRRAGVQAGERVAICTDNTLEMPLLVLAALRVGAVAVPLNQQLRAEEIRFVLQDCAATTLIADDGVADEVEAALAQRGEGAALRCVRWAPGSAAAAADPAQALEVRLGDAAWSRPARVAPGDSDAIFYTSGTTRFPQGARLSSASLLAAFTPLALLPLWPRYSVVHALPTAHIMGFAAFLGFLLGAAEIHHLPRFDAHRVLDLLEGEAIDGFLGVPTMYKLLLEAGAESRDLRSVRVFASAADVMPGPLIERFKRLGRLFGRRGGEVPAAFVEIYGSVELSGAALARVSLPGLTPAAGGFVGVPLPGYRARVVDPQGRDLPPGAEGELLVQGPGVFQGYHGRSADTDATLTRDRRGPWLRTGDLAARTPLGFIRFVGREKDVIKVGGYSVFPAEIEARLQEHPHVAQAAVVGLPHPAHGAVPVAFVCLRAQAPRLTDEALHAWITERVARYKAPRRVVLLEHDQMPYGATGKITRRDLQARYRDLLLT